MPRIKVRRPARRRRIVFEDLEDRVVLSTLGQADVPHVPVAVHLANRHQPDPGAEAGEGPATAWPDPVELAKAHPKPHHAPKRPASHAPKKQHGPKKHHGPTAPGLPPVPTPPPGYLTPTQLVSWGDGSGVPTTGNTLVIVGIDSGGLLHIRIFDSAGVYIDTFETKDSSGALHLVSEDASSTVLSEELESSVSAGQADPITALKQQLPGLLPPHVLSGDEIGQVFIEATSITGQTPFGYFVIITGHVSGNVAFLDNGIPTVAPGPIAGASVSAGELNMKTDQQGNFTSYVEVDRPGELIGADAFALTYLVAYQNVTWQPGVTTVSISLVLPDDPNAVSQRLPLFDGTGDGVVDQAGNQYHYLGRGEYYATIGGQTEYFVPIGEPEDYACAALGIEYYTSSNLGVYENGGGYFSRKEIRNGGLQAIYAPEGGGVYGTGGTNLYYFKPLP
jgi:hypothetical protein